MLASKAVEHLQRLIAEHGDRDLKINSSRSGHKDADARMIGAMMDGGGSEETAQYFVILDWPLHASPHRFR